MNWPDTLLALADGGDPFVIVTIAATRGSTPRETGAKMFVTADRTLGTIGGGQLEYECTAVACQWFDDQTAPKTFSRRFTLGADCGQCCGGVADVLFEEIVPGQVEWLDELRTVIGKDIPAVMVTAGDTRTGVTKRVIDNASRYDAGDVLAQSALSRLVHNAPAARMTVALPDNVQGPALFEPLLAARFEIVVFGAGHVGSAVVASLSALSCHITWIDSRPGIFPDSLPANVSAIHAMEPQALVERFGSGCYYLVMTHSHAIDLEICARILSRADTTYCGLIGSGTKRRQFEKRLLAIGLTDTQLQGLTCPIGIGGIRGKKPAEIAIATAAQLLQHREYDLAASRATVAETRRQGER